MAIDLGSLVVKIETEFSDFKTSLQSAIEGINKFAKEADSGMNLTSLAIGGATTAVVSLAAEVYASVKAFAEHEQIAFRLAKAVGTDTSEAFIEYASSLQKSTAYSHDAIMALELQLTNYGVLPGSIEEATKAVLDYAAATGKDLPSAAASLGQALSGQARELKRFGLTLDEGATRTQNLSKVVQFLENRFGGTAEQLKGTTIGAFESLKNTFEKVQEQIGRFFLPSVTALAGGLKMVADWLEKVTGATNDNKSVNELAIQKIEEQKKAIIALGHERGITYGGVIQLTDAEQKQLIMLTREEQALKTSTKETEKKTTALKLEKGAINATTDAAQSKINMLNKELVAQEQISGKIEQITRLQAQTEIATARNSFEARASFSEALAVQIAKDTKSWGTVFANTVQTMTSSFASGMADLIVNGGKFKDAMAQIGKDVLRAFIEDVLKKMVEQAIASVVAMNAAFAGLNTAGVGLGAGGSAGAGPTGGVGIGNLMGAGGMIAGEVALGTKLGGGGKEAFTGSLLGGALLGGGTGAIIGGQVNKAKNFIKKHFSGGVIKEPTVMVGANSGHVGIAGEDGPEALMSFREMGISPEEGARRISGQKSSLGGKTSTSGGVTINVSGQFVEADPAKWQRLVRQVILPQIRRYTDISPVGPFQRRRGQAV